MAELVYPPFPPEMIGDAGSKTEVLPVVERTGLVVGRTSRFICHYSGLRPLHPVVHLELLDRNGRIYLQKRSGRKNSYPHYWDYAVGGHVGYGEFALEALFREAGEELGLCDFNPTPIGDYVFECEREKELVFVYAAVGDFEPHPDNDELKDGRWWTVEEIEDDLDKSVFTPNFETEFRLYRKTLFSLL